MQTADYIIFLAYLAGMLVLGGIFARKQRLNSDFFLAGRSMHWVPIGLSIMATVFSAINYTAFSGEVFGHGLYVMLCLPIFPLVALPITRIVMPFYHRMHLCSAYEYLERRFDTRVRCLASGLFIIWRIFWMATALFVPCKVLSIITGLDVCVLIVLAGVTATIYTMAGGMKAVMWTDVVQFVVLFGGILLGVAVATARTPGGVAGMLRTAATGGLIRPFYPFDPEIFSLNPHIRITLWSCWIGTFTAFLARYGADQVVVQRYFTARSLKHVQRGFHLNYISAMASLVLLAFMGWAIYAHALRTGILGTGGACPLFYFGAFVQSLPGGATGLIVAGLFAATMSSVDSGINSCCAAFVTDFYSRFSRKRGDAELTLSRLLTLGFGAVVIAAALNVGRLGSVFEIANKIVNGFGSPLLAVFLLGMFSRRANSRGMLIGGLLGVGWSAYISFSVENIALHYYAVVNLLGTLFFCYLFSLTKDRLAEGPSSEQLSWLWRTKIGTPRSTVT